MRLSASTCARSARNALAPRVVYRLSRRRPQLRRNHQIQASKNRTSNSCNPRRPWTRLTKLRRPIPPCELAANGIPSAPAASNFLKFAMQHPSRLSEAFIYKHKPGCGIHPSRCSSVKAGGAVVFITVQAIRWHALHAYAACQSGILGAPCRRR